MPAFSRRAIAVATGLAVLAPLAACSAQDTAATTTLVYATGQSEPDCLDPHVGGNWPQAELGHQVLESLFARDDSGEIVPWLAESSEVSDDGLTLTVPLKEGIEFSDGTPFDADAVVANMEHVRDPDTASSTGILALAKVDEIVATDDHTVEFRLNTPDSALTASLAQTWLAIMSPAGLERGQDANCEDPIGTGYFKVESWERQNQVTLVRNETHQANMPGEEIPAEGSRLERLEWRFIPDAATRAAALQAGQVDVIDQVQPDTLSQLSQQDGYETVVAARPGTTARIELNSTRAPFNDPQVREAFAISTDIDAAVESLYFGTLDRAYSPLSSSLPEAVDSYDGTNFADVLAVDTDRANQLLDEAGYTERNADGIRVKDGQPLTVSFPLSTNQSIPAEISLVEQIAASAAEVGFDVQIEQQDISSWYASSGEWDFDAIIAPYSKSSADVLRIVYHSDGNTPAPSGYHANNTGLADPEIDAKLDEAGSTTDEARRSELYAEVQAYLVENYYVVPLYDQTVQFAYRDAVSGFRLDPSLNLVTFTNVTVGA